MTFLCSLFVLTTSFFFEARAAGVTASAPKVEFLGQKQSSIPWGRLPKESFLSFEDWKKESDLKDQVPDWEKVIRERNHSEMVGRMYQCVGTCKVDRGDSTFNSSYRSGIYEGDEIQTIGDSYAWIFLFDGTMVRLSPHSSITFNEFNVGVKENFISARVNAGNILWLSRLEERFVEVNVRETDMMFFPNAEYEAIAPKEVGPYSEDNLLEVVSEKDYQLNHYRNLNKIIAENNLLLTKKKPTYAFIVMPNATLMGFSPSVEIVSLIGGKSFFKKRSQVTLSLESVEASESSQDLFLQLRGFDNKTLTKVEEDSWFYVEEKGRGTALNDDNHWLNMGEFITKRIPTIMMGREIFLKRYSEFAFREKYDPMILAKNDGYRLWGKLSSEEKEVKSDLELRLEFLKEYFRRVETSNLLASSRFKERLTERGEKSESTEYGTHFFISALNRYYRFGEKNREEIFDDKENTEVLNSTQKTLWKKMHGIK